MWLTVLYKNSKKSAQSWPKMHNETPSCAQTAKQSNQKQPQFLVFPISINLQISVAAMCEKCF